MINFKRGKKGDTVRWNAKKKSGWIYDGTWWRHYRDGKPTGKKEKHRISAKSPVRHLGVGQALRRIANQPTQERLQNIRDKKAKKKAERQQKEKLKLKKDKESVNEVLNQKPVKKKPKLVGDRKQYQDLQKAKKNLFGKKDKTSKSEKERLVKTAKENINKKKTTTTTTSDKPKKRLTAREKMRAKNVERFGQAHVDKLRAKHADFKKMKKREMSRADFIKKYPKSQTAKRSRR